MTHRLARPGRVVYAFLAVAWAIGIHLLSALPGSRLQTPSDLGFLFNFCHAPLYFVLCALALLSLVPRIAPMPQPSARRAAVALGLTVGYAVLDEWHQSFVPGRSSDPLDVATDAAGAVAAVLAVRIALDESARRGLAPLALGVVCAAAVASAWLASP